MPIKAFVCTHCGYDIPADPEVFEEDITEEEIQKIEYLDCPYCCGPFMEPVEPAESSKQEESERK
ncbi:MAG: hypothetical protein U9N61_00020 [Euryarchaeota archaeon]|nr:hypothetical protein [Euryarchaeota archaeon]